MAITTDSYYNIVYNGETVDKIGLSKTLNNYTIEEIASMTFCGTEYLMAKNLSQRENGVTLLGWDLSKPFDVDDGEHLGNGGKYVLNAGTGEYQYPNGAPFSVVWLSFPQNSPSPSYISTHDTALLQTVKIITEWDAPKFEYIITNPVTKGGKGSTAWSDPDSDLYTTPLYFNDGHDNTLKYRINNNVTVNVSPTGGGVCPYMMTYINNIFILVQLNASNNQWYSRGNGTGAPWIPDGVVTGGGPWVNYQYSTSFGSSCNIVSMFKNSFSGEQINFPYTWYYSESYQGTDYGVPLTCFGYNDLGEPIQIDFSGAPADGYGGQRSIEVQCFCKNRDQIYRIIAGGGIKFVTDRTYKPIIENGWVTGYTDNLKTPSELDNWHGSTVHTVAPTPPTPAPADAKDNEIDVNMSQFAPSVGFVNYIEMDYETAQHVASAFNTYNQSIWNIGGDLFKNLISYKIFAVYGKHSGSIKNIHIAGHELEYNDAPINGNYIDDMGVVDLGTVNVGSKFRFNDWRDFAPYTKIECFVPCCGWCQLPPWAMGRTVTGTMYIDIANGSCKAVIKAGKSPVAEIGGCVAVDVPFSSVATGAKAAGIITAITSGAVAAFDPTPQNLISGSFGILSALNANYTETKGIMGDGSNINGCTQFLVKVTRPASTDTGNGKITARYKHEKGIPCAKTKTLASGQGFTQITDANIDGTMTDREKQMIIDGFRHGLIL